MVFAGGCATGPSGGDDGATLYFTKLSSFEGASNLSEDSYFWSSSVVVDGVRYEKSSYYLVYKSDPPGDSADHLHWEHHGPRFTTRSAAGGNDLTEYGWYAEITHPPGVYTVCGTNTLITHPPGAVAPASAK